MVQRVFMYLFKDGPVQHKADLRTLFIIPEAQSSNSLSSQILIMTSTAFAGVLLLNYQRDYTEWLLPLIIVCLFSFLVAHCFLSIFEIVVDVLFLCFAIDTKYNDGTPGKEFFMDKALMVSQLHQKQHDSSEMSSV